jgi:hypothetical protein
MTLVISKGLTLDNGTRAAAIAGVSPTLDYRFAREKREIETVSLTDKLTFTGGNQGTFVGSDGFIQPATTNVPRFDHDLLSRKSLGLLSEVERTNGIRNNTMVGAVAGTPGTIPTNWTFASGSSGITREITGIGNDNGIPYIDVKFSGTASSDYTAFNQFDGNTNTAASTGQTFTASQYLKAQAGSLSGITNFTVFCDERSNAGVFLQRSTTGVAPTDASLATQRYLVTRTFTNASTAFTMSGIRFQVASGASINITLRIGLPQLELGATASTPIPTTSAAVTRTPDSAVIDGTGVITGTYTMVEKPAGCAVVSGTNINLQPGFTAERVMVFPAALDAGQITAIRGAM